MKANANAVKKTKTIIAISLIVLGCCQSFDFYNNVFNDGNVTSTSKQADKNYSLNQQEAQ
jgi:major membrane immunogen (membrane-anchored lipoprotein)